MFFFCFFLVIIMGIRFWELLVSQLIEPLKEPHVHWIRTQEDPIQIKIAEVCDIVCVFVF